jgi:hypothetical protein
LVFANANEKGVGEPQCRKAYKIFANAINFFARKDFDDIV